MSRYDIRYNRRPYSQWRRESTCSLNEFLFKGGDSDLVAVKESIDEKEQCPICLEKVVAPAVRCDNRHYLHCACYNSLRQNQRNTLCIVRCQKPYRFLIDEKSDVASFHFEKVFEEIEQKERGVDDVVVVRGAAFRPIEFAIHYARILRVFESQGVMEVEREVAMAVAEWRFMSVRGAVEGVKRLMTMGASPMLPVWDIIEEHAESFLFFALDNNLNIRDVLLHYPCAVAVRNHSNLPLLHFVANSATIRTLLECGADINESDKRGNTALTQTMNVSKIQILIENGAKPSKKNAVNREWLEKMNTPHTFLFIEYPSFFASIPCFKEMLMKRWLKEVGDVNFEALRKAFEVTTRDVIASKRVDLIARVMVCAPREFVGVSVGELSKEVRMSVLEEAAPNMRDNLHLVAVRRLMHTDISLASILPQLMSSLFQHCDTQYFPSFFESCAGFPCTMEDVYAMSELEVDAEVFEVRRSFELWAALFRHAGLRYEDVVEMYQRRLTTTLKLVACVDFSLYAHFLKRWFYYLLRIDVYLPFHLILKHHSEALAQHPDFDEILLASRGYSMFYNSLSKLKKCDIDNTAQALEEAIRGGDEKAVTGLIKKHPQLLHATNRLRHTPLMQAIVAKKAASVRVLLESGASTDADVNRGSVFRFAQRHFDEEVFVLLIRSGADVFAEDDNGCTSFYYAILSHSAAAITALLDMGFNPTDACKEKPYYHYAIDHIPTLKLLLSYC